MRKIIKRFWSFSSGITGALLKWALNVLGQTSTFTCAATARTCWGYDGVDPGEYGAQVLSDADAYFDAGANWATSGTWSISTGKLRNTAADGSSAVLILFFVNGDVLGKTYRLTYTIDSISGGGVRVSLGDTFGVWRTVAGTYTETLTHTGTAGLAFTPEIGVSGVIDNVIAEEMVGVPTLITDIPANVPAIKGGRWVVADSKFYTTTTTGETLNPYTLRSTPSGTVRVYTAYATYATGTAYAAGVQVATTTTAGNRVYMQSSGGTSGGTAVVIADSDIGGAAVADNDINWSVLGYATGLGYQLEEARENVLLNSDAPATQTTASLATGSWTLSVFGAGSALISAGTATITGEAACTEGAPNTISITGAGTVTVTVTGSLDYFQLEAGTFPTSIIITGATTLARAATLLTDTTAGRLSATSGAGRIILNPITVGQTVRVLSSSLDGTNYFRIQTTATVCRLYKIIAGDFGVSALYAATLVRGVPVVIEFYYNDVDGMAVRLYSVGDTPPAWGTNANTTDMPLGSIFAVGADPTGGGEASGEYISVELSTNKEDLNFA